jgi:NADP-dependent 3-hydroxy acid dehydrogenase YdfG
MAKLDGKIALISGGTSGIGAETAKLFQSEGATVVVTGSSERSVEAAKVALPGIEVLLSDAGNVAATKTLVDQVKAKHGRIDVVFVNAGCHSACNIDPLSRGIGVQQLDADTGSTSKAD